MTRRVGLVCPYSLSVPGGVQAQVLGLARQLRRMGVEARVLGPCDGAPPTSFVTPLGNSLPTAANGSIAPLAPDLPCALRTIRALRDEQFDVLHLHEPLAPGPTLTSLLLHPAPMVGTFHAAGRSTSYRLFAGSLKRMLRHLAVRVVVSKDALALVQGYLGGEFLTLYNGVELDVFRGVEPTPSPDPTILFLGRHEERKGLAVLLDAFDRLPGTPRLWVAGDGPATASLRAAHPNPRIEWLGRISDDDRNARMVGADVFCAPSLHGESFGVVLIEAMAAGTTVVASGLDGYRNVATDGVDALLVEPGNAEALAAAIQRALTDRDLAARLRAAGTERAEQFSMKALAEKYLEIYEGLVHSDG